MSNYLLLKKAFNYFGILSAALFLFLIFQGQLPDDGIDDNDPRYERPTRESMSHFRPPNSNMPSTITI
ncbi:MAG TPA: hypothetical protein VGK25_02440, partial [Ignavibacteria bacterium]